MTPFLPLYNELTAGIKNGTILTPDGNKFAYNTVKNYVSGIRPLKKYEQAHGIIYLEDINIKWAENFTVFLMSDGYCKNTISVTISRIKAILRRLNHDGIGNFAGTGIRAVNEAITTVFNTIEEVRILAGSDFSETPGYDRVRDIYILQCFLGLRYSDLSEVLKNPQNYIREVGNNLYFEIKTKKTGETVVIPISRTVKQVCERYGYDFGELFSYQYYNKAIKHIARKAGLTQNVVFTRTEGGERKDSVIEKCELMSSHTARRTFATNAFLAGISEKDIMQITGHKTTQSFYKYVRNTGLQSAIKIANHEFFKIEMPDKLQIGRQIDMLCINN